MNKKQLEKFWGVCICWGRQNLKLTPPHIEVKKTGMFYLALACHQLSQLVAMLGLPEYVTSYVHRKWIKTLVNLECLELQADNVFLNIRVKFHLHILALEQPMETPLDLHRDGAGNGSYMVKKEI